MIVGWMDCASVGRQCNKIGRGIFQGARLTARHVLYCILPSIDIDLRIGTVITSRTAERRFHRLAAVWMHGQ